MSTAHGSRWIRRHGRLAGVAAPLALTLLAAVLRLPTISQQSFWLDEAYTERLMHMSLAGMWSAIPATESTPPLYYTVAWGWTHLFGTSELGLRSLSAVAGILIVPVVFATARRLAGARAGAIAGLLAAVAPLLIWFSQEGRAYALATLLSAVTVLCFVAFLDREDGRWLAGWALSSILGIATHYFVGFVVAGELLWLLAVRRRDPRVLVSVVSVMVAALALAPLAISQRGTGHADYISQGSLATRLAQVPKQLLVGYASPAQLIWTSLAALLVIVGAAWPLISDSAQTRGRALPVLAVGLGGLVVPVLLAFAGVDFINTRNLLPALPPLLVVAAIGFASAPPARSVVLVAVLGLLLLSVTILVDTNPQYQRADWRGISHALGAATRPRAIVVDSSTALIALGVYQRDLGPLASTTPISEIDVVDLPPQTPGGGIGAPVHPTAAFSVPPGFHLVHRAYATSYAVLTFRAPAARYVSPQALSRSSLRPGSLVTLFQSH